MVLSSVLMLEIQIAVVVAGNETFDTAATNLTDGRLTEKRIWFAHGIDRAAPIFAGKVYSAIFNLRQRRPADPINKPENSAIALRPATT